MAYTVWTQLDQVEHYASTRYRHWDQRWISNREQKLVRRWMEKYNMGGEILDAPVGYGRFQPILGEYGHVYALDFNYYAALYQTKRRGLPPRVVTAVAEQIPFKDDAFDLVFSFRLLQHMHDPNERRAIFSEYARVSRKWVIVSLYLETAAHTFHRKIFKQPSHITMMTKDQLVDEVAGTKLRLVDKVAVLPGLHAHNLCLFTTEDVT